MWAPTQPSWQITRSDAAGRIIITGGTSGIGLGIARRIVETGGNVLILGRDETRGKHAVEPLAHLPKVSDRVALADMCDEHALLAAVPLCTDRWSPARSTIWRHLLVPSTVRTDHILVLSARAHRRHQNRVRGRRRAPDSAMLKVPPAKLQTKKAASSTQCRAPTPHLL